MPAQEADADEIDCETAQSGNNPKSRRQIVQHREDREQRPSGERRQSEARENARMRMG